jgi:FkbM family methyltransferase
MRSVQEKRPLVFDVGLHKGEDTDFYLKKGFNVVAIEADPELASECRSRFAPEIEADRLHIIDGAISRRSGRVSFYKSDHSVWGTTCKQWAERNERLGARARLIEIDTVDIGTLLQQYGVPYYLKVDIEGSDRLVLDALRDAPVLPPFISIESEKVSLAKLRSELLLLKQLGYSEYKIVQQESIPGSVLRTTTLNGQPLIHTFENHSSGPFGDDLSGRWLTYRQAMLRYVCIFLLYRLFGDDGLLLKIKGGGHLRAILSNLTKKPLPGWFDTHARWRRAPSAASMSGASSVSLT